MRASYWAVSSPLSGETPTIKRWLLRHPRLICTSRLPVPSGSTWSSAGSQSSPKKQLHRVVHRSTYQLEDAISHNFEHNNRHPKTLLDQNRRPNPDGVVSFCKPISNSGQTSCLKSPGNPSMEQCMGSYGGPLFRSPTIEELRPASLSKTTQTRTRFCGEVQMDA